MADTIYALSSGRPPAAIGVIRVSGPSAHAAGEAVAGSLPKAGQVALRVFSDPGDGAHLDRGLVLRFDGPASATGEDVVEFHVHGSRAVAHALLGVLASFNGLREAQSGEFTRRAFENGRIDLTEAEGLADLLEAETETQRKAALRNAEGGLRRQIESWQQRVVTLSARAEAAIDYVGEDETQGDEVLNRDCAALALELEGWLSRPRIEPLKDGVRIVVAGPPNAGKSSLINVIAGQERAIVTAIPGTTRDHLEVPLSLDGLPVLLTDTAGLRDSDDPVERIGVARAQSLVAGADILVWLGEPDAAPDHPRLIRVHARCDVRADVVPKGSLPVSSVTNEGVKQLLEHMVQAARELLPGEDAIVLNRRQAAEVSVASNAVRAASLSDDVVLQAEELRAARLALDRVTGRAGVEDLLDALFGRFCLGK